MKSNVFKARTYNVNDVLLLRLPEHVSKELSTRGQVSVKGTINGYDFRTVLEPDGYLGHWMCIDDALQKSTNIHADEYVDVRLEQIKDWPEPIVPEDLRTTLSTAPVAVQGMWDDITPMARWEWVRWVNATNNLDTRKHRVDVSISKMQHGKRRQCCFNLSACTDPRVSKNGRLIELHE